MSDSLPITDQRGRLVGRIKLTDECRELLNLLDPEDWMLSSVYRIDGHNKKDLIGLNLIAVPAVQRGEEGA